MPQPTSRREAVQAPADVDLANLEASSVVAAIVLAPDGRIVGANARMRRLLGITDVPSPIVPRFQLSRPVAMRPTQRSHFARSRVKTEPTSP